jgi:hypothetical protein
MTIETSEQQQQQQQQQYQQEEAPPREENSNGDKKVTLESSALENHDDGGEDADVDDSLISSFGRGDQRSTNDLGENSSTRRRKIKRIPSVPGGRLSVRSINLGYVDYELKVVIIYL